MRPALSILAFLACGSALAEHSIQVRASAGLPEGLGGGLAYRGGSEWTVAVDAGVAITGFSGGGFLRAGAAWRVHDGRDAEGRGSTIHIPFLLGVNGEVTVFHTSIVAGDITTGVEWVRWWGPYFGVGLALTAGGMAGEERTSPWRLISVPGEPDEPEGPTEYELVILPHGRLALSFAF